MARHVDELLTAYVHGELHGHVLQQVEEHLAGCGRCRRELARERKVAEALGSVRLETPRDELWQQIQRESAPRRRMPLMQLAFGAAAALAIVMFWPRTRPSGPAFLVEAVRGDVSVENDRAGRQSLMHVGQSVRTANDGEARVVVADIGEVHLKPDSELSLVDSGPDRHRLRLSKGTLSARVSAPPRLFVIETPSADAVDLGCAYTLSVDAEGATVLHVDAGWVSLEREGPDGMVPAGWSCVTHPKSGVGTPVRDDASTAVKSALAEFDRDGCLEPALRLAKKEDALAVWHMLGRVPAAEREQVYAVLSKLSPPPKGVTREAALSLEAKAMEAWRQSIAGVGTHFVPSIWGFTQVR